DQPSIRSPGAVSGEEPDARAFGDARCAPGACTCGLALVISMIVRRMPGVNIESGLTSTCGEAIAPWMAYVMPNTPWQSKPETMGPNSGISQNALLMPCSGT